MKKTEKIGQTIDIYRRLLKISKRLHSIDERLCNGVGEQTEKSLFTQQNNLMTQANELASYLGVFAFHQGDPRGCGLYLVDSMNNVDSTYSRGVAIY